MLCLPKDLALSVWSFLSHTPATVIRLLQDKSEQLLDVGLCGGMHEHSVRFLNFMGYTFILRFDAWVVRKESASGHREFNCEVTKFDIPGWAGGAFFEDYTYVDDGEKHFIPVLYGMKPDFPREQFPVIKACMVPFLTGEISAHQAQAGWDAAFPE